ncbi:hypothetical protein MKZ38_006283 [Zalerion maritima]|uniref:Integral membrane protein n=1 Tax=Zalerion maritima TaxID=339359 RepID=A0AAD5RJ18_9PEZI|nr:hypothetical protein MKZ38_006283 [Zalerion maritima]
MAYPDPPEARPFLKDSVYCLRRAIPDSSMARSHSTVQQFPRKDWSRPSFGWFRLWIVAMKASSRKLYRALSPKQTPVRMSRRMQNWTADDRRQVSACLTPSIHCVSTAQLISKPPLYASSSILLWLSIANRTRGHSRTLRDNPSAAGIRQSALFFLCGGSAAMPGLIVRHRVSGLLLLLCIPIGLFLFFSQYARTHFWRDPTSAYFDASRAYERRYTARRLLDTSEFVDRYNVTSNSGGGAPEFKRHAQDGEAPFMCIGMNTIIRPSGEVYARNALGSVLAGMLQVERDQIFLMPMIGHINASLHPIFTEPWLSRVADRVLTYKTSETLPPKKYERMEHLELERQRTGHADREKHLADYTHLLRVCAETGAAYVTMLEDDVLLMDGWFHRTKNAIEALNRLAGGGEDWFYLRLFYTEANFGWQSEEWGWYGTYIALLAVIAYALYRIILNHTSESRRETALIQQKGSSLAILAGVVMTFVLGVVYVFRSGRLSIFSQPEGVIYMPMYGCCAQGIVYPASKIEPLTGWYEKNRIGFVDTLAERLADEKPDGFDIGTRWGINPVLLQHVGGKSSKGDGWAADQLWNFKFEDYDPEVLRWEHESAVAALEGHGEGNGNEGTA